MTKFNLNDLRHDAAQYLTDQIKTDHRETTMALSWCSIPDLINTTDFINLLDLLISALLGDFMFRAMYDDPALSFTAFDLGLTYPGDLNY